MLVSALSSTFHFPSQVMSPCRYHVKCVKNGLQDLRLRFREFRICSRTAWASWSSHDPALCHAVWHTRKCDSAQTTPTKSSRLTGSVITLIIAASADASLLLYPSSPLARRLTARHHLLQVVPKANRPSGHYFPVLSIKWGACLRNAHDAGNINCSFLCWLIFTSRVHAHMYLHVWIHQCEICVYIFICVLRTGSRRITWREPAARWPWRTKSFLSVHILVGSF